MRNASRPRDACLLLCIEQPSIAAKAHSVMMLIQTRKLADRTDRKENNETGMMEDGRMMPLLAPAREIRELQVM